MGWEDIKIKFTGARPGEKLREELVSESDISVETPHPDIIQLLSDNYAFQPDALLAQLDTLKDYRQTNTVDARAHLLAIANHAACSVQPDVAGSNGKDSADDLRQATAQPTAPKHQEIGQMNIPMSSPDITPGDVAAVNEVLQTRWLSLGPKLDQLALT